MRTSNLLLKLNLSTNSAARRTMWKLSLPLLFLALVVYVLSQPMQAGRTRFVTDAAFASRSANKAATGSDIAQSNTCFPSPSGLVSWWPGEGNANDSKGNNHGALRGDPKFETGKVGLGFSLDGIDDYVEVPDHPSQYPGTSSFTLEAWIKTGKTTGAQYIVSKYENGLARLGLSTYSLWVENGKLVGFIRDTDGGGPPSEPENGGQILTGRTLVAENNYHHVAMVRDLTANRMRLYVDGVEDASAALNAGATGAIRDDDGEADPFIIGATVNFASSARSLFFSGIIDEVSFYARALSLQEIQAIFNAGKAGKCTVATASAASFKQPPIASESIVASFGTGLATAIQSAPSLPLPITLAGTTVKVTDSAGTERSAPLFFVSPTQVNYQIPRGTTTGMAGVTIASGNGTISYGVMQIESVAPGLFGANADGQGVAAAVVVRVKANGDQMIEPVAQFDPISGKYFALPIDLGPETDQVFLIPFGTGFRSRSALSAVMVKIGGLDSEVLYAGEAPGFVGLDQLNVRLSRSLIGRGAVDVELIVDGKTANLVKANIK